ncbi:MAG: 4-hydroxy-3-methylbut-2-enyl diphosphate reductase [Spirochaetota bacterium]
MEVIVARTAGFCSGVKRTVKGAEKKLQEHSRIYCLGDIIHNPDVVTSLKEQGMVVVHDTRQVPRGSRFVVRSHGLDRTALHQAEQKGLKIHDFTCPKVKKIHYLVQELTEQDSFIHIIGNRDHPEVQAVVSLAGQNYRVVQHPDEVETMKGYRSVTCVVQTTFNPRQFLEITKRIVFLNKKTVVYNTLCEETINRQQEAASLAEQVDLVLVVGGKHSSNTRSLYELVREHTRAVHIENAGDIKNEWFEHAARVGIVSGASTPRQEVERVYYHLTNSTLCQ